MKSLFVIAALIMSSTAFAGGGSPWPPHHFPWPGGGIVLVGGPSGWPPHLSTMPDVEVRLIVKPQGKVQRHPKATATVRT